MNPEPLLSVLVDSRTTGELTVRHPRVIIAGLGLAAVAAAGGVAAAPTGGSPVSSAPAASPSRADDHQPH